MAGSEEMNGDHRPRGVRPNRFTGVLVYHRVRSATPRMFVVADCDIRKFLNFDMPTWCRRIGFGHNKMEPNEGKY